MAEGALLLTFSDHRQMMRCVPMGAYPEEFQLVQELQLSCLIKCVAIVEQKCTVGTGDRKSVV